MADDASKKPPKVTPSKGNNQKNNGKKCDHCCCSTQKCHLICGTCFDTLNNQEGASIICNACKCNTEGFKMLKCGGCKQMVHECCHLAGMCFVCLKHEVSRTYATAPSKYADQKKTVYNNKIMLMTAFFHMILTELMKDKKPDETPDETTDGHACPYAPTLEGLMREILRKDCNDEESMIACNHLIWSNVIWPVLVATSEGAASILHAVICSWGFKKVDAILVAKKINPLYADELNKKDDYLPKLWMAASDGAVFFNGWWGCEHVKCVEPPGSSKSTATPGTTPSSSGTPFGTPQNDNINKRKRSSSSDSDGDK